MRRYHYHVWYKVIDNGLRGEFRIHMTNIRRSFTPRLVKEAEDLIEVQGGYKKGSVIISDYKLVVS
jgi:hypothetical protein